MIVCLFRILDAQLRLLAVVLNLRSVYVDTVLDPKIVTES